MNKKYIIIRIAEISLEAYENGLLENVYWRTGFWEKRINKAELFDYKKDAKTVVRKIPTPGIYKIEKVFIVQ